MRRREDLLISIATYALLGIIAASGSQIAFERSERHGSCPTCVLAAADPGEAAR